MEQGFLVEIAGSHGVGKTTLAKQLQEFYELDGEMAHSFLGGEVAREVKDEGITINEEGNELSQCIIFSGILRRLLHGLYYWNSTWMTFSDRSLICPTAYSKVLGIRSFILNEQLEMVNIFYNKVKQNGILFYLPIEFSIEDDKVRSTAIDFQRRVDEAIVSIFKEFNIPHYTLTGDVEKRLHNAVDAINEMRKV
ncbi:unnamed protein product [marine sediment metagenome]|uniref:NadR/Ttd14 AAA domain-containing protein n=1 Tax=marine sediment metagenome TaxID=412755 RepID=X1GXF1_9ZZZZ